MEKAEIKTEVFEDRKICFNLLKKRQRGEISQSELEKEMVYLALDSISELAYQKSPVKPKIVMDFLIENNKEQQRQKVDFWTQDINASNWLTEKNRRKTENITNWYWLNFYKNKMKGYGDMLNVKKIENIIDTFPLEEFGDLK